MVWYARFTALAPFRAGTRRAGWILLNSMLGRLDDPAFPNRYALAEAGLAG